MSEKFQRREVAIRRVEWIIRPPDPDVGVEDYARYEADWKEVVDHFIRDECGDDIPQDLRVIEQEDETIISYEIRRVVLK